MNKLKKIKIFRIIVQVISLLLFPGLITLAFSQIKDIFTSIATSNYTNIISNSIIFIILAVVTIFAGRIFCGWLCIFGSYNDWVYLLFSKLTKKKIKISKEVDKYLKYLKYIILIFIVVLVWTNIVKLPNGSSPWDAYTQILDIKYMLGEYLIGAIILLAITVGAIFIERFFCRYLCPLGAVFSILSKFKIFKVHKERTNCNKCKACSAKCSMGIDLNVVDSVDSGECIQCFNCIGICPNKNAKTKILDKEVNETVISAAVVTATIGAYSLSNVGSIEKVSTNDYSTNVSINQNSIAGDNLETNETSNTIVNTPNENTQTVTTNQTTETVETNTSNQKYKDGVYTGTARGYRPGLTVSVTVKNDKITSIEIVSSNETPRYLERVSTVITDRIIENQSTNVDAISGATRSSDGIMNAVENALLNAEI